MGMDMEARWLLLRCLADQRDAAIREAFARGVTVAWAGQDELQAYARLADALPVLLPASGELLAVALDGGGRAWLSRRALQGEDPSEWEALTAAVRMCAAAATVGMRLHGPAGDPGRFVTATADPYHRG